MVMDVFMNNNLLDVIYYAIPDFMDFIAVAISIIVLVSSHEIDVI